MAFGERFIKLFPVCSLRFREAQEFSSLPRTWMRNLEDRLRLDSLSLSVALKMVAMFPVICFRMDITPLNFYEKSKKKLKSAPNLPIR